MALLRLTILGAILIAGDVFADFETRLRQTGLPGQIGLAGTEDQNNDSRVYIVQLTSPAAAEFHSATAPRISTKTGPGSLLSTPAFDKSSSAVASYVQRLESEQAEVITKAGGNIDLLYNYRYALNGFAARISPAIANKLEHMPEVLRVWQDEVRPLVTNHSANFLDLFNAEDGLRGPAELDGDGVVIGVIDSGVYPEHPSLQDTRPVDRPSACWSTWAEFSLLGRWLCKNYTRADDIVDFEAPPVGWNGICETGPEFTEENCNNKMIGARTFSAGATATGPIDDGEIFSPRDVDGHGTHIATTAAGNRARAEIFGTFLGHVEGMAPRARIATYKACWLRPGGTRASCNTSDLANAIDMAVADGVDIINYSIGSTIFTVTAPDDIALLAAAKAGVLSVVAAGNEGPLFQTISSPASNPAVMTVGASSRDGEHSLEALQVDAPASVAGKYATKEAAFTPPLIDRDPIEGQLILADDEDETLPDGGTGTTMDGCQVPTNTTRMSGNIAFIQRGGCDFDVKVANAEEAGAVAVVVFNLSGDPIVMTGDSVGIDIPAVMMGAADGTMLLDEINNGENVDLVLDKSFFLTLSDTGNIMGMFSSRGPGTVQDILKPDVTAPGINILAGHTPDAIATAPGESFQFLSGTSMSAPHVAGVAALLKQAHPDWSPAALKSSLMTTARQDVAMPDESNIVPFDYGSGHIEPNTANDPGLVYDMTDDEYDTFSCAIGSPDITQQRCDDLAAMGVSFEPADVNQPNISLSRLTTTRTVTRRVTNVAETSETYNVEIELPPGVDVQVTPASLTVAPGQTAEYDVTMAFTSGPQDIFRFGSLTWVGTEHRVRSVISIQPLSVDAPGEIFSFGGSGSETFSVNFGYSGPYTPGVHGLRTPLVVDDENNPGNPNFIAEDPDRTFTPEVGTGVNAHVIVVPDNEAFLRFALFDEMTDGNDDLDMYLYYCPVDLNNCFAAGLSGGETSREQIDIFLPGGGLYVMFIHGFETDNVVGGPGAQYTALAWSFGLNENLGNMTATGPAFVTAGSTEDVIVNWNGLGPNTIYLGGISHNTPEGLISLTLINIGN
ncbi:MAG: S8 family serine peptidase [Woeseiaceae bacterium]